MYKYQLCFYTLTMKYLSEKEISEAILFTIASKIMKYLEIYLPMEVEHYIKNYKILMKEIKDKQINGKIHACGWEELLSLKCTFYKLF